MDRQISVLLEQSEVQRRLGNHRGATELAQRALTLDPDHARAHAVLAFTLIDARRLDGALLEMRAALALDSDDRYVHHVAAAVLAAHRKLDDAWAHCEIALGGDDAWPETYVLGARVRGLQGDRADARRLLLEALVLDAAHTDALSRLAQLELDAGDRAEASRLIALALETDPADRDAHVVAGHIDLANGDPAGAEQHARFVLHDHATSPAALELWAAVQARRSRLLGVWWRWNLWITLGDERRRVALLIGSFVAARVAIIVAEELGYPGLSRGLRIAWLALCAYTWLAPLAFRRLLARSLGTVRLDPSF
jgi:tetratricopeptide (TPR) repeat protein